MTRLPFTKLIGRTFTHVVPHDESFLLLDGTPEFYQLGPTESGTFMFVKGVGVLDAIGALEDEPIVDVTHEGTMQSGSFIEQVIVSTKNSSLRFVWETPEPNVFLTQRFDKSIPENFPTKNKESMSIDFSTLVSFESQTSGPSRGVVIGKITDDISMVAAESDNGYWLEPVKNSELELIPTASEEDIREAAQAIRDLQTELDVRGERLREAGEEIRGAREALGLPENENLVPGAKRVAKASTGILSQLQAVMKAMGGDWLHDYALTIIADAVANVTNGTPRPARVRPEVGAAVRTPYGVGVVRSNSSDVSALVQVGGENHLVAYSACEVING